MQPILKLHPGSRCDAVSGIAVEVVRSGKGVLALRYVVSGSIGDLVLPAVTAPGRADELWRRTCFEAFVRRGRGAGYLEFNFAPSTQWAAYQFDGYRAGRRPVRLAPPQIAVRSGEGTFELGATVALDAASLWRLGLSAVIEETNGRVSYWALAHPPGKPDFHHADCFALQLPATGRP